MTANAEVQAVLDRAADGGRITPQEALDLYRSAPLHALGAAADAVRRRRYAGTEHIATYIIERNINYTNVCVTACKFCAFYAPPKDTAKGWTRDLDDILRRCAETVELGGTQIMFQGGHHPDYGVEYYEKHFAAIKQAFPQLVIHSLGRPRSSTWRGSRASRPRRPSAASTRPVSTPSRARAPSCCPSGRARPSRR
ncbi:hypothetical protein SVIO_062120 [Streptomyces violaceusniger]|uniref:Radical SAM core domain-containing protein n=1 Tax=Streptomyces violaceusniger TaxID=68280 RepID=A0A4D4LC74_STRVO|nr:hypothetical protein SVIO_062120 [Streptomyces violaceusniger]